MLYQTYIWNLYSFSLQRLKSTLFFSLCVCSNIGVKNLYLFIQEKLIITWSSQFDYSGWSHLDRNYVYCCVLWTFVCLLVVFLGVFDTALWDFLPIIRNRNDYFRFSANYYRQRFRNLEIISKHKFLQIDSVIKWLRFYWIGLQNWTNSVQ